ncbi:MAG: helix-turn-helix domain-containing protein [Flavobacterium sp.]
MDIGNKIKTLRVQKKFESITMAEKLGISINTYRKYERNQAAPDINMLEKIAKIHDISVVDLFKEEGITFNNNENTDCNINNLVINQMSEKLIEQKDKIIAEKDIRLAEKEERIQELKEIIAELKKK